MIHIGFGRPIKGPAKNGKLYPRRISEKKGRFKLIFELPYGIAEPLLGDIAVFCGAGKTPLLANAQKMEQIPVFHARKFNTPCADSRAYFAGPACFGPSNKDSLWGDKKLLLDSRKKSQYPKIEVVSKPD
jgi:hypothetical protein